MSSSFSTLSLPVNYARFLGSRDRVFVAGNSSGAEFQILFAESDSVEDSPFVERAHLSFPKEYLTSCELCAVSRLNRSFVAAATSDLAGSKSTLRLLQTETTADTAEILAHDFITYSSSSSITSLAFQRDLEFLASANESGEVVVWDVSVGKEVVRFAADPCGVTSVAFATSGQLVSIGQSNGGNTLKVWDIRALVTSGADSQDMARPSLQLRHNTKKDISTKSARSTPLGSYTSMLAHPLQEVVLCGSSEGVISSWDLRVNNQVASHFQCHGDQVNALCVHPVSQDIVLSGGSDGAVRATNLQTLSNAAYSDGSNSLRSYTKLPATVWDDLFATAVSGRMEDSSDIVSFDSIPVHALPLTLWEEAARGAGGAVNTLDCLHVGQYDPSSGLLTEPVMLAGTSIGGLLRQRLDAVELGIGAMQQHHHQQQQQLYYASDETIY